MYNPLDPAYVTREFILTNFQSKYKSSSIDDAAIRCAFCPFRLALFLYPSVCFENGLFSKIAYFYCFEVSSPGPQFCLNDAQISKEIQCQKQSGKQYITGTVKKISVYWKHR